MALFGFSFQDSLTDPKGYEVAQASTTSNPAGVNSDPPERRFDHLVLDLAEAVLKARNPSSFSETAARLKQIRKALVAGTSLKQNQDAFSALLQDKPLSRALTDLSQSQSTEAFLLGAQQMGSELKKRGATLEATLTFQWITQLPDHPRLPVFVPMEPLDEARMELSLLQGRTEGVSFNRRLAHYASTYLNADAFVGLGLQGSAWVGLGSILCAQIRPLEFLSAAGMKLLSTRKVAAALWAGGTYLLYKQSPLVGEAWSRLSDNDYPDQEHSPGGDAFLLGTYFVSALGVTLTGLSFALDARAFLRERSLSLQTGRYTPEQIFQRATKEADTVRRMVQAPESWTRYAYGTPGLTDWQRAFIGGSGKIVHHTLIGGSMFFGVGSLAYEISQTRERGDPVTLGLIFSLLNHAVLNGLPGISVHLYQQARGNRNYGVGPAMLEEITEPLLNDPTNRALTSKRLRRAYPPLPNDEITRYVENAERALEKIRGALDNARFSCSPLRGLCAIAPLPPLPTAPASGPHTPFRYSTTAKYPSPADSGLRRWLAEAGIGELHEAFKNGVIAPSGVARLILSHPAAKYSPVFPTLPSLGLRRWQYIRRAEKIDRLYERGAPVNPVAGIPLAQKALTADYDGTMTLGSKLALVNGVRQNPNMRRLRERGMISYPAGMSTAAEGGTGVVDTGFGPIPNPHNLQDDVAGSSGGTAHIVASQEIPISVGTGSATSGSVENPAGATDINGLVLSPRIHSREGMAPFHHELDHFGYLANHPEDLFLLAELGTDYVPGDPLMTSPNPGRQFQPLPTVPRLVYSEGLLEKFSTQARQTFLSNKRLLESQGYEVIPLGREWDWVFEVPVELWPMDAYYTAAASHANALQKNPWGEPPRNALALDKNVARRDLLGVEAMERGFFDDAVALRDEYNALMAQLLGEDTLFISPASEPIAVQKILTGKAGHELDTHDYNAAMFNGQNGGRSRDGTQLLDWSALVLSSKDEAYPRTVVRGPLPHIVSFFHRRHQADIFATDAAPRVSYLRPVPRPTEDYGDRAYQPAAQ